MRVLPWSLPNVPTPPLFSLFHSHIFILSIPFFSSILPHSFFFIFNLPSSLSFLHFHTPRHTVSLSLYHIPNSFFNFFSFCSYLHISPSIPIFLSLTSLSPLWASLSFWSSFHLSAIPYFLPSPLIPTASLIPFSWRYWLRRLYSSSGGSFSSPRSIFPPDSSPEF